MDDDDRSGERLDHAPLDDARLDDARLDLEFAYTPWTGSCRDLYSPDQCCRRPLGHSGTHAAGFGARRVRWAAHVPAARSGQ